MKKKPSLIEIAKPIIDEIADQKQKTGTFAYFTKDDIYQEVWSICLKALDKYNKKRGDLQNYLNRCVSNGLKNLYRDKYYRLPSEDGSVKETQTRINLVNAIPLCGGDISNKEFEDPSDRLAQTEQIAFVRSKLPENKQKDFDNLLSTGRISRASLPELLSMVRDIVEEQDNG